VSDRARRFVFLIFGGLFLGLYCYSAMNLPAWGFYRGPYGFVIANIAVYQRHATDVVNAINYDYRGFDTLGEEFILFTAVLGVMLLLRHEDGSKLSGKMPDVRVLSTTIQAVTMPAVFLTVLFGFYVGLHGQLTPGGGFQAGVILSTASVLVYIAQNTEAFRRITSHSAVELIEAVGAGGYALVGLTPLLMGVPFLTNFLPLGETGDVFSSGTIAMISALVGIEVTAAFLMVTFTYLQEIIRGEVSAP
jgi:multicomponent Na+:H+ antiporter subunit B